MKSVLQMQSQWIQAGYPQLISKTGFPTPYAISTGRVPLLGIPAAIPTKTNGGK